MAGCNVAYSSDSSLKRYWECQYSFNDQVRRLESKRRHISTGIITHTLLLAICVSMQLLSTVDSKLSRSSFLICCSVPAGSQPWFLWICPVPIDFRISYTCDRRIQRYIRGITYAYTSTMKCRHESGVGVHAQLFAWGWALNHTRSWFLNQHLGYKLP